MLLIQGCALHLCPHWTFILAFIFVKKDLYNFWKPVLGGLQMHNSQICAALILKVSCPPQSLSDLGSTQDMLEMDYPCSLKFTCMGGTKLALSPTQSMDLGSSHSKSGDLVFKKKNCSGEVNTRWILLKLDIHVSRTIFY